MFTDLEFFEAMKQFATIVEDPIEYRFHYNDDGIITMCTMQNHPENTQYLVVTKFEYDNYFQYVVIDGKLKMIDKTSKCRVQLKRSDHGYKTVKNHAGILLEDEVFQDVDYYDNN